MNKIINFLFVFLLLSPSLLAQVNPGKKDTSHHAASYTCPMHEEVTGDKPGKCPKCGMELTLSKKENYNCPLHPDVVKQEPGNCPKCGRKLNLSVAKTYTCPMHPHVTQGQAGKCPKCGAALVEKKN